MPQTIGLLCKMALVVGATAASPASSSQLSQFDTWKFSFGKTYSSAAAEASALGAWLENTAVITEHNARHEAGLETFTLKMNQHGDLTNAQYRKVVLRRRTGAAPRVPPVETKQQVRGDPPASWNWVDHGVVPPVKNQGDCGSCWSFSAVAAMEGAFNLKNNGSMPSQCATKCGPANTTCCSFSEQEEVDCTLNGTDTCKIGGEPHDAIVNVVQRGGQINTEAQYPYTAQSKQVCRPQPDPVASGIRGYSNVSHGDEDALAAAAWQFPVISVGIDASSITFQFYSSGVYTDKKCKNTITDLDHGVAVVGYGTGTPPAPGPPPPKPGPADCSDNHYKFGCTREKGCHWCTDKSGLGYCLDIPCPSEERVAKPTLDFFLVRNSWGASWGMNGYIAMARGRNNMCGIATDAAYAVVQG